MRSRRKTVVVGAALGITALTVAAAWFARGALLERWWIHRLSSKDPEVRATMVARLARSGGDAAARALAERVVAEGEGLDKDAVAALEAVFERVRPETRVWVTKRLVQGITSFDLLSGTIDTPVVKLLTLASRAPETLEVFVEGLERNPEDAVCIGFLAQAWPAARERVKAWFVRADPARLGAILGALYSTLDADASSLDPSRESDARRALDDLVRAHPRPEVRAVALVHAALVAQNGSKGRVDPGNIGQSLAGDPEPIVRMTALKLAGVFAGGENGKYLKALLLGEKDPGTLTTVIEARALAALDHDASSLLLAPGIVAGLLDVDRARFKVQPLDAEEVLRLETLLLEAKDPSLRDAASRALAIARSGAPLGAREPHSEGSGLEVHEWSVWKEEGPPASREETSGILPDLPTFVRRTQKGFDHVARLRVDPALPGRATAASTVFFHAPRPLVLTLRTACLGGVPRSRYPEATNLLLHDSAGGIESRMGVRFVRLGELPVTETPMDPANWGYWGHARSGPVPDGNGVDSAESWAALDACRKLVPWARSASLVGQSSPRGFGLAWEGLRVGYAPELEGEPPSLQPGEDPAPWSRARKAGSATVALGGDHERFLFHEGVALAPSPVVVEWEDKSRRALVLRTRDFLSLPIPHDWRHREYRSLRERGERIVPATAHVPAVLVVQKEAGKPPRGTCLRNLPSRSAPASVALDRLELEGSALSAELGSVLEDGGLARGESEALLAIWEEKFLEKEGLRVLTVIPRWLHDALLPLEITPVPDRTIRVGIIWKECDALEVRASPRKSQVDLFGPAEPLEVETSTPETRRKPLEPGPAVPFEIRADGLLAGIWPGQDSILFAEDGRFFAHPKDGLAGEEIHVGDLEERELTMQVRLPPPLLQEDYTICADGSRVGLLVLDGGRYRVLTADIRRGALIEIVKEFGALAWTHSSRDGRVLSFLEDGEPRLFDLDTSELRRVRLPPGAKAFYPMLTPDGKKMALILESTVVEGGNAESKRMEVALVDLEARTLRRLANVSGTHRFPSISADGRKVLFTRTENSWYWLYLADLEGSRLIRISPHVPTVHTRGLIDASTVFFTNENGIWTMDLRTGASRLALEPGGFRIRDGGVSTDGGKALLLGAHPVTGRVLGIHHVDLDLDRK